MAIRMKFRMNCRQDLATMMKSCFLHYWPFVRGIHRSLVDSPHKGPVIRGFDVFLDVSFWANDQISGDLRHHDTCVTSLSWYIVNIWHKLAILFLLGPTGINEPKSLSKLPSMKCVPKVITIKCLQIIYYRALQHEFRGQACWATIFSQILLRPVIAKENINMKNLLYLCSCVMDHLEIESFYVNGKHINIKSCSMTLM